MGRSHEASHRKVEAGRAELPLIVTIGGKVNNFVVARRMFQDVSGGFVYLRVALTAFFVGELARVSNTGDD